MESLEKDEEDQKKAREASNTSIQPLDVKSTAVLKYTKMLPIENYSTLELNTDINEPPHNWLHDNLQGRFNNWISAKHEPIDLSSLNMAHTFPENIDEVDVISDAENIKKLLKMPFSEMGISMSVNKVGRTLLLDEFDVQDLLSQAAQEEDLAKLTWLQEVFSEEANIEKDQTLLRKKKNPSQSRERNMMSKFLCYSSQDDSSGVELDQGNSTASINPCSSKDPISGRELNTICKALVPFLPEPILKPQKMESFQRNVVWKFEDTKMLIGSNMPIFGGGKYPAVSLRLKDCAKPINVLTGLDYWLDNLMCNVPEVVMCFHLDGIVQKYEHYKTDELPNIEGSQFSPRVIKDVARNILSFLKSNCTLEGHTYWLFKGNGSDVVKLYDLTSLCDKTPDSTNPFSVPVAMLLYRVAKSMIHQSKIVPRERDMIQVLLTNCLHLLNNEERPEDHLEIITSSHYLLAELYSLRNDESGREETIGDLKTGDESKGDGEADEAFDWPKTLTISDLSKSNKIEETYKEMTVDCPSNVKEKLHLALSHVVKALKCLRDAACDRKFPDNETKRNILLPSRPYRLALPDAQPPARPTEEDDDLHSPPQPERDESAPQNFNFRQWQGTFESVLIRKTVDLYSELLSLAQTQGAYGTALRYARLALGCLSFYRNMEWVNMNHELDLLPTVLCGCGDVYLAMALSRDLKTCLQACEVDYQQFTEHDKYFYENFASTNEALYLLDVEFDCDVEKLLLKSLGFYEKALDNSTDENQVNQLVELTKRLGNVRNELGLFYMNTAVEKSEGESEVQQGFWNKSLEYFNRGIRAFQALDDRANIALLYANSGRLMRTCCQTVFHRSRDRGVFDTQERSCYNQAIELYQKSLRALCERKSFPGIWDRVSWELSGAYYTMGCLVQDFTSLKDKEPEQCEREVSDLMFKALKHCESVTFLGSEQTNKNVQNRIGRIHYRLASLYHHSCRALPASDQNAKKKKHLAELHYTKAAEHIDAVAFPCEWLRAVLERVALLEHQLSGARLKGAGANKILDSILEILLNSQNVFLRLSENFDDVNTLGQKESNLAGKTKTEHSPRTFGEAVHSGKARESKMDFMDGGSMRPENEVSSAFFEEKSTMAVETSEEEHISKEFASLVRIFESQLKNCLQETIKLLSSSSKMASACQKQQEQFKRMFEVTLRGSVASTNNVSFSVREQCEKVLRTLRALKEIQTHTE